MAKFNHVPFQLLEHIFTVKSAEMNVEEDGKPPQKHSIWCEDIDEQAVFVHDKWLSCADKRRSKLRTICTKQTSVVNATPIARCFRLFPSQFANGCLI
jgi:hypothetical protein